MADQVLKIKESISEIRKILQNSRNDSELGMITSFDGIEHHIIFLTTALAKLEESERGEIEPLVEEVLEEMKEISNEISSEMQKVISEMKQIDIAKNANTSYLKTFTANDN